MNFIFIKFKVFMFNIYRVPKSRVERRLILLIGMHILQNPLVDKENSYDQMMLLHKSLYGNDGGCFKMICGLISTWFENGHPNQIPGVDRGLIHLIKDVVLFSISSISLIYFGN